jgi:hypothetical protein
MKQSKPFRRLVCAVLLSLSAVAVRATSPQSAVSQSTLKASLDALEAELRAAFGRADRDLKHVLERAIAEGDRATARQAREADEALGRWLKRALEEGDAAVLAAASQKIADLDASLRALIAAGNGDVQPKLDALKTLLEQEVATEAAARAAGDAALAATDATLAAADAALGARIDQEGLGGLHCAAGQIIVFDGARWACADLPTPAVPPTPAAEQPMGVLLFGDQFAGWIWSLENQGFAQVVNENPLNGLISKHVASVSNGDIVVGLNPFAGSPAIGAWINAFLQRDYKRKDGKIVLFDETGAPAVGLEFNSGGITELAFPALNVSSPTAEGLATLRINAERVRPLALDPSVDYAAGGGARADQRKWLPNHFRLEVAGLPSDTAAKLDAFSFKAPIMPDDIGITREPTIHPQILQTPDLSVTVARSGAAAWDGWFTDFLINGHHLSADERSGAVVFLAPDDSTVLGRIAFQHAGIFSLTVATPPAFTPTAGLYFETAAFELP